MVDVDEDTFGALVEQALDGIPPELGRLMRNVAVVVEDQGDSPNLLGLYHGIPLTERTSAYAGVLPDRITIYRQPILAAARTEAEAREEIRLTVLHEIGHYFGLGDDELP